MTIVVAGCKKQHCNDNLDNDDNTPQSVTISAESGVAPASGSEDVVFGTAPFTPGEGFSL